MPPKRASARISKRHAAESSQNISSAQATAAIDADTLKPVASKVSKSKTARPAKLFSAEQLSRLEAEASNLAPAATTAFDPSVAGPRSLVSKRTAEKAPARATNAEVLKPVSTKISNRPTSRTSKPLSAERAARLEAAATGLAAAKTTGPSGATAPAPVTSSKTVAAKLPAHTSLAQKNSATKASAQAASTDVLKPVSTKVAKRKSERTSKPLSAEQSSRLVATASEFVASRTTIPTSTAPSATAIDAVATPTVSAPKSLGPQSSLPKGAAREPADPVIVAPNTVANKASASKTFASKPKAAAGGAAGKAKVPKVTAPKPAVAKTSAPTRVSARVTKGKTVVDSSESSPKSPPKQLPTPLDPTKHIPPPGMERDPERLKADMVAFGFAGDELDILMKVKEPTVDHFMQIPNNSYAARKAEKERKKEAWKKKQERRRATRNSPNGKQRKNAKAQVHLGGNWYLFDPIRGYPPTLEDAPPAAYDHFSRYKPSNTRVLAYNMESYAVRLQKVPESFQDCEVQYLCQGPKLVKIGNDRADSVLEPS